MPDKTKTLIRGCVQKRKTVVNKSISEEVIGTSFGAGRGVSVSKKHLKLPQAGGSPGDFFSRQDKNSCQGGGFKREKQWGTRVSQSESQQQVLGPVEVFLSRKNIETPPNWRKPWRFFTRQDKTTETSHNSGESPGKKLTRPAINNQQLAGNPQGDTHHGRITPV